MKIVYLRNDGDFHDNTFYMDGQYSVDIRHYDDYDIRKLYNHNEFMKRWCGFSMEEATAEEIGYLLQFEEVNNMPFYPDDGSIIIIDNYVIVNF